MVHKQKKAEKRSLDVEFLCENRLKFICCECRQRWYISYQSPLILVTSEAAAAASRPPTFESSLRRVKSFLASKALYYMKSSIVQVDQACKQIMLKASHN